MKDMGQSASRDALAPQINEPHQPAVSNSEQGALVEQLCELTKRWTEYEDIPGSQRAECRSIGQLLHKFGGMRAMQDAYYEAKGRNRAASSIQPFWDGVGDWRW